MDKGKFAGFLDIGLDTMDLSVSIAVGIAASAITPIPWAITAGKVLFKIFQNASVFKKEAPNTLDGQMHKAMQYAFQQTLPQIHDANQIQLLQEVKKSYFQLLPEAELSIEETDSRYEDLRNEFQDKTRFPRQDMDGIVVIFKKEFRTAIQKQSPDWDLKDYIVWDRLDNIENEINSLNQFRKEQKVINKENEVFKEEQRLINKKNEERFAEKDASSVEPFLPKCLTDPPPRSTQHFIGRETETQSITESIQTNQKLVLVNGMGGIGKSEIAKKLFHLWHDEGIPSCENTAHFGWIPYTGDIKGDLAVSLYQTKSIENKEDAYSEAVRYINDLGKKLILFIDNVNNPPYGDIELLASFTCLVILTSRTKNIPQCKIIEIGKLSEDKCLELYLKHCSNGKNDEESVRQIIRKADCHTLAVELLAKTQKKAHKTPKALFEMIDEAGFSLMGISEKVERKGINSVFIEHMALLFSLADITKEQKHILQLFAILPYLPLQGVLMLRWFEEDNYDNVNELMESGWLMEGDDSTFQMHPVIAEAVRHNTKTVYTDIAYTIRTISTDIKVEETELFTKKLDLVPFAESVMNYCIEKIREKNFDIAQLEFNIGFILSAQGEYQKALNWYKKAQAIQEEILEKNHFHTIRTYNNIAFVYLRLGEYTNALKGYEKVRMIREIKYGKDHRSIATVYNNIANVNSFMGNYEDSLKWYKKACNIREKKDGKDHPSTASIYNNIANTYTRMGDYKKAFVLFEKARIIREKKEGKHHPSTAATYHNIAFMYSRMGRYDLAFKGFRQALAIRKIRLGEDHIDTALSYNDIASIYLRWKKYEKALDLYTKALKIREHVLGKEHPDTAITHNGIAVVHCYNEDYDKALDLYKKNRRVQEKTLGREHPDTMNTYHNIAVAYSSTNDYHNSLLFFRKEYTVLLHHLGRSHPKTRICYNNTFETYLKSGLPLADFATWLSSPDPD